MPQRLLPLMMLLVIALGAPNLAAQDAGLFTIGDIRVDVTAENARAAREQAFAQGQRLGLAQLLRRLGVASYQLDPQELTDAEMARLVQGFQVNDENASAGRYVANLTYDFRPDEVRRLLRGRAIEFTEVSSKPVVIIPVYRSAEGTRLWDSPNPWLDAWLNAPTGGRLVPITVPFGDLQDVRDITAEAALSGDRESLRTIADRYGAGSALVTVAEPQGETVVVSLNHYDTEFGDTTTMLTVEEGSDPDARLAAAVGDVTAQLEETWRMRTRTQSSDRNVISVVVPLYGTGDGWFQIQERLQKVPTVVGRYVVSLSPQEGVLEIHYVGTEEQFRVALNQQDLAIEQGFYAPQLRLAGGGR